MVKMNQILNLYKPLGLTPFQLLKRLRLNQPDLQDTKITYVGRLDPLAHGVQIYCCQPTKKSVEPLKGLEKEYTFRFILGVETDSYDLMGIVSQVENQAKPIRIIYKGSLSQPYPPFSAKMIKGKPLHYWAKHNLLSKIELPYHLIKIQEFELNQIESLNRDELIDLVHDNLGRVEGDFRQDTIVSIWNQTLKKLPTETFFSQYQGRVVCSSGTYIRQIVHEIGAAWGGGATVIDIERTRVGTYTIASSIKIDNNET